MRKDSIAGRLLGILVFLIGIAILVVVAVLAYTLFTATTSPLQVKPDVGSEVTAALGASAVRLIYQILLLIVLCIAGSLVAARGLLLYFVATGPSTSRSAPPVDNKPEE